MNSILNLNTTWTAANFLNYIEHSFSSIVLDWYDSLNEDDKNIMRMMEIPTDTFKNLCKEIRTRLIGDKLDSEEKAREWKEGLII